jgi:hypothetical protein
MALVRERPPLVGEVSANCFGYGYRVVSAMDPLGHILDFLDRNFELFKS